MMPSRANYSTISLRLFSFLTIEVIFFVFFARHYAMGSSEFRVAQDGGLTILPEFETYMDLDALLKVSPEIQNGELISQEICNIKSVASKKKMKFKTQHGFFISIPKPDLLLENLIKKVSIVFVGNPDFTTMNQHALMLRKVLPAVTNHQLLSRALANPRFKFVIDYTEGSEELMGEGNYAATNVKAFLITLTQKIFIEESLLLGSLRNEFASMNMVIANDCRLGRYSNDIYRSTAFGFYSGSLHMYSQQLGFDDTTRSKIMKTKAAIEKNYHELIAAKEKCLRMSLGQIPKTDWFKQLESHLINWSPCPSYIERSIGFIEKYYPPGESRENKYFREYYWRTEELGKEVAAYILPKSFEKTPNNTMNFYMYKQNPTTLVGKLHLLYATLLEDREITITSPKSSYANRPLIERYAEWISFLEGTFEPSFLQFLFPEYCDYMTQYTELDKISQNYCAP